MPFFILTVQIIHIYCIFLLINSKGIANTTRVNKGLYTHQYGYNTGPGQWHMWTSKLAFYVYQHYSDLYAVKALNKLDFVRMSLILENRAVFILIWSFQFILNTVLK